jgi:hypothetical protein
MSLRAFGPESLTLRSDLPANTLESGEAPYGNLARRLGGLLP